MKIKDSNTQIREKIAELKRVQEDVDFRKSLASKKLRKLDNSFFVNTDKLRMANWEYEHQRLVLQLLD